MFPTFFVEKVSKGLQNDTKMAPKIRPWGDILGQKSPNGVVLQAGVAILSPTLRPTPPQNHPKSHFDRFWTDFGWIWKDVGRFWMHFGSILHHFIIDFRIEFRSI